MRYILTILLIFLAVQQTLHAESMHIDKDGVSIDLTLHQTTCTVGDPITLDITAITTNGKQLTLQTNEGFGSFSVIDLQSLLDIPIDQGRSWSWSLTLDTFDASSESISGINLIWSDTNGQQGVIDLEPIPVVVESVAKDTLQEMQLRGIKGAVPLVPTRPFQYAIWILLGIICMLLCKRLFHKKTLALSPSERAMRDLQLLKETPLEADPFFTQLSDIVRTFIEGRFHIAATGQTTREFLIASKNNAQLEHSDRESLTSFLVAADLVKFARFEPSSNACTDAISQAERFILAIGSEDAQETKEIAA